MDKKLYAKRKEQGLCPYCGGERDTPKRIICTKCADKQNKYNKHNWQFYKSIGICPRCKKEPVMGSDVMCFECRAKHRDSQERNKKPENEARYNEQRKAYMKSAREKAKAEGICVRCLKRKAIEGRTRCSICVAKDREYRRNKTISVQEERKFQGLCPRCGKDKPAYGYKWCTECIDKSAKVLEKARSMRDGTNKHWINSNRAIFERRNMNDSNRVSNV